jgi:cobalamin-dependent methionine synthase I
MKQAVAYLEPKWRSRRAKSYIVLATVKGDVHDIGRTR